MGKILSTCKCFPQTPIKIEVITVIPTNEQMRNQFYQIELHDKQRYGTLLTVHTDDVLICDHNDLMSKKHKIIKACKKNNPNDCGFVFSYQVVQQQFWFSQLVRSATERLLHRMANPSGTFLLRRLDPKDGFSIALSVRINQHDRWSISHYRIREDVSNHPYSVSFQFQGDQRLKFPNLNQLVSYFQKHEAGLTVRLNKPCPPRVQVINPNEMLIDHNQLTVTDHVIGRGNWGEVLLGEWCGIRVAVKQLKPNYEDVEGFIDEAKLMAKLVHENILNLLCWTMNPVKLVTEYMNEKSLNVFLRTERGAQTVLQNHLDILHQVSLGMCFLVNEGFLHRDLRAANILLDSDLFAKVGNFGLSRDANQENAEKEFFPIRWASPEVLSDCIFTEKSDVWSFGILIYETISYASEPYEDIKSNEDVKTFILRNDRIKNPDGQTVKHFPEKKIDCPYVLWKMMEVCWSENPDSRWKFNEIQDNLRAMINEGINQKNENNLFVEYNVIRLASLTT